MRWLVAACWFLVVALGGCDSDEESASEGVKQVSQVSEAPRPASKAPAPTPAARETEATRPDAGSRGDGRLAAHMRRHAEKALAARDAVIRSQLDKARAAMAWLAEHDYSRELPEGLRSHAVRMRYAAAAGDDAESLEVAAKALGTLAATCGGCHRAAGAGPKPEPSGWTLEEDDLRGRMHRHLWAAERMWEGLILPWDRAWSVGAQVLAEAPFIPVDAAKPRRRVRARIGRVQALGKKAAKLEDTEARAELYGHLLGRCAACHEQLGIEP